MLACMDTLHTDLNACFAPSTDGPSKKLLVKEPGLTMLYLTVAPGQAMPEHNHPGCHVTIQGMVGEATVLLDGEAHVLRSRELLCFDGGRTVSPGNRSSEPAAVLITLAEVA